MKAAKHSFKRYLAYLLVCALVMSNISVTAYAADTTSVPNDEVNITQEETLSDPENDTSSASEIIEEENADSSDVEIFDEENDDPSAEQSLEDELIEDNPMETVSDDQESDISDAASENEGAGTDEDSIFTEDKTQMNPLPKKMPTTALAADRGTVEVPYINDLGGEASADATLLTGSETELGTGFYAVTDNVIFNHPVTVTGSATRIILCDGKTAAFSSISTTGNCQLRFYGQEKGSGSLTATNLTGGLISIYGGTISAGTMTATPLNMFDGTLSADALTVGWYADFTMSSHFFGGIVDVDKLTVQDHDFTIGTENTPSPTDSFCAGSYVIAQGLKLHFANTFTAAEPDGNGAYIRYSGDYDNSAAAALAGKTLRPYISFTVNWVVNDVTVETDTANNGSPASYDGGEPTKDPDEQYSYVFTGWSDGENTYGPDALPPVTADVTYTAVFSYSKWPVSYVDLDNQTQTVPNVTPITDSTTELNSGWYAVTESITNGNRIIVNGDVNLILCDGATLTAPEGIGVNGGQSLTIWGQMRGTGALLVDGGDVNMYYAGIGGDEDYASGVITINGGTVTAAGGQYAAGIGGSNRHNGSITINGGTVTATGGEYAACIGAGYNSDATVTINGGKVTANGAASGATGIGGGKGDGGSGSIITLSWTDATGGTMFVNSTSYNGSVTLQKAFMAGLTLYPAGAISDNSTLNGETLRPCTANIHKIEVACLRTDGKTASSTVTADGEAPVGNVVTLTVNAAAGEKLTEQQELSDFQLTNGFIAFYRDDNENIVFVTIDKSGNSYCFVMPDYDVTIYAVMEPIDYSIAFNEPIHGNTTVHKGDALEEISTAHAGDTINVLFSASSSNAYIVTEMTYTYTEDGEEKTGTMELTNPNDENVYFLGTFTMPASDVRISITYQGAYTITYEPSAGISLKQEKFSEVAGETVTLTPYDDYTVPSVSVKCGDEDIPVNTNASGTFSFTMPEGDVVVSAEYVYDFSYVNRYWNESTKSVESEVVDLDPSSLTLKQLTLGGSTIKLYYEGEGLIFFTRDLTFNDRYTISGNMKFIIADGVTVTFSKGIAVNNGATLSIYGQSSDSGKLIANSENYNAAIGSDDQDKDSGANGGGAINIHGGTILATAGSDAAGIGGGNEAGNGNITIYGGTVTAQGGQDAAGIGTGDEPETTAGDIRIYGGTVTAHSVGLGAGIGGGDAGKGGRIYIYGGTVNATGGTRGAGIGGGEGSVANTIQIDGGTVYASGGTYAAGIGTGYDPCNNNGRLESIVINGGNVNATSGYYAAAIGSGTDENITGGEITINGGTVRTCVLYDGGAGIGTGRNSHCGLNITINGGDVAVDHRYTTDEDGEGAAGIGSGYYGDFTGKITITGGVVNAVGSGGYSGSLYFGGAGIGGGCRANVTSGAEIKITGGTVTAVGKNGGAAIGAGAEDHLGIGGECEGSITITGGKVTLSLTSDGGDDAVYCGHGDAGDDNGTLTLAGSLKVYSEGSAPVAFAQRTATSQSHSTGNLVIEACDHPNKTYTITESTHTAQCAYCNTSFDTESHSYASGTNQCSVCGYLSKTFTVSFNAGDGSGTMNSSMVVAGEDYILPACDFTAPEGKAFVGWLVGETQYEVGETITVTMNTTVTAMWEKLCTITFDSDGGSAVESQTVTSGEKATKPEDPTKEGFTFQGWYQVTYADAGTLAEEAFDFENTAISEDITLKAVWQSDLKLAVYSTDTKFGGSVANVTVSPVKTGYKTGESVTVTAEEKQGYTFLGWYAVTGVSESRVTGYGDKLAETLAYTFDITKDTQITAVYEAKGKATVKIIAVNGAKYMVGDDTTIKTGSQENVPIGTTLKLTAADADQVFQWQNESEKILGTGSTLEYYVTSNTTITLVYQYDAENQSYVQFVSDYGQVLSYNQYSVSSTIDFPVSPTKYGYTFEKWVFEGTEDEATAETIKAKIGTEKIITLKPKYTKDEAVGSVTVNYKAGDTKIAEASVTADIPVGNTKTFTAQDIDGYTFECWKSEDGTVLGYKKDYFMQVTGEHVLNACYVTEGGEVEEAKPTIVIGELEKVTSGSTHKVRGSVTRSIPEGYTLIEHGILYARDKSGLNEDTFVYSDGTDGIIKRISTATMMNGVVSLNVKVDSDDVVVSFRGYMILKNSSTGEQTYYYTAIKEGSYQSIQ